MFLCYQSSCYEVVQALQQRLELIHESGYLTDEEFESVYDDNQKIIATLINIIKKVKEKKE